MPRHLLRRLGRDERGQALVLALAIAVVGMIVGLGAIAYALNVGGSATHDEHTRGAQQAADAGVQGQLLGLSGGSLGYTLSPHANGFSSFANLQACAVPDVSGGQILGTLGLGVSSGPCPIQVPTTCATNASACTNTSAPWSANSNGSWSEAETFPSPQLQGSSAGDYPILFPETVSLGCKTSDSTSGASTCNAPSSAAASRNSYAREMALLDPTAPLQAVEGENDVQIYSPGQLGQTGATSVIDGNIVAGNILKLPAFSAPVTTLGGFGLLALGGGSAANAPSTQLGGASGQIASLSGVHPVLDYGYHCYTTPFLGATSSTDNCATATAVSNASMSLDQTGTASGANPCTAGSPSTNCWLARPAFSLSALSAAGQPSSTCSTANLAANFTLSGGVGSCSNGFLSYTGNVTLKAPGTYVFCNVDVGGQLQSSGSGPIQIFIAGQGQDGCSTSGFLVAPTARADSTGSPALQGTTGVKIDFGDGTSGGTTPYTIVWNFGDGSPSCTYPLTSSCLNPSHTYSDPAGTYTATETVTDASGLAESYAFTVIVTAPLIVGTPSCTLSPAISVVCTATASGGTPSTSGYSYSWNFGDNGSRGDGSSSGTPGAVTSGAISGTSLSGLISTGFNYAIPGTYLVSLTVTDSTGASQTVTKSIPDTPLTVSLPSTPAYVPQGTASSFGTATLAGGFGGPYTYQWNFGDGGTGTVTSGAASGTLTSATVPAISYKYAAAGTYVATLSVTGADGQTVATYVNSVIVAAATLTSNGLTMTSGAALASSPTGPVPLATSFSYATQGCSKNGTNGSYSYLWNFEDGSATSTSSNPSHTYSAAGTYIAQVRVTCTLSSSSLSQIYLVTVIVSPFSSSLIPFSTSASTGTPPSASTSGSTVTFTGTASGGSGSGYTYSWSYGDGSNGTGATHTYSSAGTYTVGMTVTDSRANTASYDLTVIVTAAAPTVSASANINPIRVGVNPSFTATISGGTGPYASYTWNFGDGSTETISNPSPQTAGGSAYGPVPHTFMSAGTYLVTLTVTDANGQVSSTSYAEVVSPTAQSANGGGDFIVSGGINQLATDNVSGVINGATTTSSSVDPAAFQIYMQGDPTDSLAPGSATSDPGALGSFSTSGSYASIGGSGAFIDAFVIYAPRSGVNITAQPSAAGTGGVFEGSAIGWNTSITALMILQDFNLGNYPLSSVVNADSVGQTVECDNSVVPLINTSTDLNGCT